jgi:hypothetical protein
MTHRIGRLRLGAAVIALALPLTRLHSQVLDPPLPHESGQSVSPSFEGWYKNADGTYSLSFGYFNRNFKEEPDIDIGASNKFSPGPEDRGQPTHFMTRRVWGAFAVVVPKETAADKNFRLTWTITAHGQTIAIPGHLRPEWEIDALKESTSGNIPPILRFEPNGPTGLGPLGITASMKAAVGQPTSLTIYATDDGVKKKDASAQMSTGLGVAWSKYRGHGTVKFDPDAPKIQSGKATTLATFSEPGDYTLRLHAWDDSGRYAGGFQCCWSNGFMKVSVAARSTQGR